MAVIVVSTFGTDPSPGTSGDGLLVSIAIVLFLAGLAASGPRRPLPRGVRLAGVGPAAAASCIFAAVQPDSAGFAGVYYVVVIAGIRMPRVPATIIAAGTPGGGGVVLAFHHDKGAATAVGLVFSVVPWFLITRLIRQLAYRRDKLERAVEELRESREAAEQSAALAERGRMARDMHDVLAHSLSALALQLEGTRLLATDRGADAEVVAGLERAHRVAARGAPAAGAPPPRSRPPPPPRGPGRPPRCAATSGGACAISPTRSARTRR